MSRERPPESATTGQSEMPETGGEVVIRCREDGPLVVEMPAGGRCRLRVNDHRGGSFPLPTHKRAVALCRCGRSGTRPFCDGSHREAGFRAAEIAPVEP